MKVFKEKFGFIKKKLEEMQDKQIEAFRNGTCFGPFGNYPSMCRSERDREAYIAEQRKELANLKILIEEWEREAREEAAKNASK